jgi:hypothetical protein
MWMFKTLLAFFFIGVVACLAAAPASAQQGSLPCYRDVAGRPIPVLQVDWRRYCYDAYGVPYQDTMKTWITVEGREIPVVLQMDELRGPERPQYAGGYQSGPPQGFRSPPPQWQGYGEQQPYRGRGVPSRSNPDHSVEVIQSFTALGLAAIAADARDNPASREAARQRCSYYASASDRNGSAQASGSGYCQ